MKAKTSTIQGGLHFFKRINRIRYTFSNESLPLHDIFSSESQHKSPKPPLLYLRIHIYVLKVKLTEGEKEMASPKPRRTKPYRLSLLAAKNMSNLSVKIEQNKTQSKTELTPHQTTKSNSRESVNPSPILQPESANLSPICLIFANRRFRGKRG